MSDAADSSRYRVWVTIAPEELSFATAIGILRELNRQHPELGAIGSGSNGEGQVYALNCAAENPGEARHVVTTAFDHVLRTLDLSEQASVADIHTERIW
ncbi:MAG TPA: hypothetical protein VIA06_07880 [Candidatus Dormibacteraeota bacterium]|nr:hypothetical protein [Candidatus Dormibacteraeota bacterium]